MFPLEFRAEVNRQETRVMGLSSSEDCLIRGVARGGTWVNVPHHGLKKNLAPVLQTDDCFATGVTRQTLLKPKENVQFQRWFFENFLGTMPQAPILGRGYGAPPQTSPPRRFAPPRLARDLRSLHRRVPPYKNPDYAPVPDLSFWHDTSVWRTVRQTVRQNASWLIHRSA